MKAHRLLMIATLFIFASLALVTGCKYDVAEPLWEQPYTAPPTPSITQVDPAEAKPGANTITITGVNLYKPSEPTLVYFDNITAEILSMSPSSIMVRRPNLASQTSTIKIVPQKALIEAKYSPYKIDQVSETYGSFLDNLPLSSITADNAENIYVVETGSRYIYKVTPSGDKTLLGIATRASTDGRIGPDGNLYLIENHRAIDKVDLTTGEVSRWTQMPSGKVARFGDFDANGYFYTGGNRTDLCIVPPNPPTSLLNTDIKLSGSYASEEILAVRVFNNYVYVASRIGTNPPTISRNLVTADGTVGTKELVFDMNNAGEFSSRTFTNFELTSTGKIFIATDAINPILVADPASANVDIFYKGILRPYCKQFCWGNADYLYMITGDTNAGEEWNIYRVDMGNKSAQ